MCYSNIQDQHIFSDIFYQLFQEVYESYRSYSRKQWENNSVPTREAMAVLGKKSLSDLPKNLKTEAPIAHPKLANAEANTEKEFNGSAFHTREANASNICWRTDEANRAQSNRPDKVS